MAPNSKEKETESCESERPTEIKKQNIFDMDLHHQMPSKSSGCFSIDLKQSKGKCFTKWGWMTATSRDDTKNEEEVRSGSDGRMMKGTLTVTKRD
ncbi:hypothetical protein RUM43_012639 [Polyplax serrata]|uniref:Uncharacterized protein n=1 Tax=Polyplax serrata TaxID=468196 RepID=A0AAN8S766_POLSC